MNIVGISDIHLFNRRNLTIDIISNLDKYFIPVLETGNIKLLLIAGDLFDRRLQFNHDDTTLSIEWMYKLLSVCNKYNIILRVLEGTPSHDWEQSKHFTKVSRFYKKVNFKYISKISIEYIPEIDKSILYVPDEATESTEKTLQIVKELMYQQNLESVDIGCMHGMFKYQLPNVDIPDKNFHDETEYLKLIKGPIIIGHIHKHKPKGRILSPGSFDRLSFNENENKGFLQIEMDDKNSSIFKKKFIINKSAKIFEYIDGNQFSDLNALYTHFDNLVSKYPKETYLSIKTTRKSFIADNINSIQNRYVLHFIIEKTYIDKKTTSIINQELKTEKYLPLQITKNNILELLSDRMKNNKVNTLDSGLALLMLGEIIND